MAAILQSSHSAVKMGWQNRRLEAGIAAVKPDFAMSKLMESSTTLLAIPDEKLVAVRDDLKLTAIALMRRAEALEEAR